MLSTIAALALAVAVPGHAVPEVPLPPGELRGQVLSAKGLPVTSFTVNNVRFDDPQGLFKILTPPEGEFRVVVRADGLAPNVFHVQGASGKKLVIPEIRLGDGEDVFAEILDAETEMPVRDARASLADPATLERLRVIRPERVAGLGVTGGGGYLEIRRAPRGLLVLVVQHPDYLTEFVPVNTRDRLPAVKLHRGGTIGGTVRDASGAPIPGARVVALSEGASDGAEITADVRGRFEMKRLRPGTYRVVATSFGKATEAAFQVPLSDGMVADVAVELKSKVRQMQLQEIELGGEPATPAPAELKSKVRQMQLPVIELGGDLPTPAPDGALASR